MRRFEILEDTEYDRYLIFIYGENKSICGVNYHHGIGDFDTSYLESDENLLKIYLERMKGRGHDDTQLSVMRASIEEIQIKRNEYDRNPIIHDEVTKAIEILTERLCDKLYIEYHEVTAAQRLMIASATEDMIQMFKQVSNAHIKNYK